MLGEKEEQLTDETVMGRERDYRLTTSTREEKEIKGTYIVVGEGVERGRKEVVVWGRRRHDRYTCGRSTNYTINQLQR